MRLFLAITAFMFLLNAGVQAQDSVSAPDFEHRLELAEEMVKIRPVREQVEAAVERYIQLRMPAASPVDQDLARDALMKIINIQTLEQTSIDAHAEIFTVEELEGMIAYYKTPAAQSAAAKMVDLNARITPEIIRMLDQAMLRARLQSESKEQLDKHNIMQ